MAKRSPAKAARYRWYYLYSPLGSRALSVVIISKVGNVLPSFSNVPFTRSFLCTTPCRPPPSCIINTPSSSHCRHFSPPSPCHKYRDVILGNPLPPPLLVFLRRNHRSKNLVYKSGFMENARRTFVRSSRRNWPAKANSTWASFTTAIHLKPSPLQLIVFNETGQPCGPYDRLVFISYPLRSTNVVVYDFGPIDVARRKPRVEKHPERREILPGSILNGYDVHFH